jgi:hypothetical protein
MRKSTAEMGKLVKDSDTVRQKDKQTNIHIHSQTDRGTDSQTDIQTSQTYRQTDAGRNICTEFEIKSNFICHMRRKQQVQTLS